MGATSGTNFLPARKSLVPARICCRKAPQFVLACDFVKSCEQLGDLGFGVVVAHGDADAVRHSERRKNVATVVVGFACVRANALIVQHFDNGAILPSLACPICSIELLVSPRATPRQSIRQGDIKW